MQYEMYVGNNLVATALSIEDVMYYIDTLGLSIINEDEDLENFVVALDCEYID